MVQSLTIYMISWALPKVSIACSVRNKHWVLSEMTQKQTKKSLYEPTYEVIQAALEYLTSLMKSRQLMKIIECHFCHGINTCFWFNVSCLSRHYDNIFQKALLWLPLRCVSIFFLPNLPTICLDSALENLPDIPSRRAKWNQYGKSRLLVHSSF